MFRRPQRPSFNRVKVPATKTLSRPPAMNAKDGISDFNNFVYSHRIQLESSGVPTRFWHALHKKLDKGIFDAGEVFDLFKIDYDGEREDSDPLYTVIVSKESGIKCDDELQIYLIDHAWTYLYSRAALDLAQIPGLLARMCNLMGVDMELSDEMKLKKVYREMWRYNQTYSYGFGDAENRVPIWYIMDEFGSGIQHSNEPNFRMVPFYYLPHQVSYTLLFPVKDVGFNEKVTRNYLEGSLGDDEMTNKALMIPWTPSSFLNEDYMQKEPESEYFLYGHVEETLPESQVDFVIDKTRPMKVYSEYSVLTQNLKDPGFELVTNEDDADICWLARHFKSYKELSNGQKFVNQYPFEHVLTVKDLLSVVCRRKKTGNAAAFADDPPWCPTTFNLKTELPQFVSYYQHREEKGLDNHWICKPWNLARGLDIVVTDNLNCILRLPATGPKIAQKYVETPVLFDRPNVGRVKFDVRYVVLLRSVSPLRVYAYRNFFLRFANKPFCMKDLWDGERHFTVMNYNERAQLYKILCDDFVQEFDRQNPGETWSGVEVEIFRVLRSVFEGAAMVQPPCGIGACRQSRALYAVDLILAREALDDGSIRIQPKILEVNWNPDCRRACEYYPTFFDDVFRLLFKDDLNADLFKAL